MNASLGPYANGMSTHDMVVNNISHYLNKMTIEATLRLYVSYNFGTRPRIGTRVRAIGAIHSSVVLGFTPIGYAIIYTEETGLFTFIDKDDVFPIPKSTRLSQADVVRLICSLVKGNKTAEIAIHMLACFFNGNSGANYANPLAMAWGIIGHYRNLGEGSPPGIKKWTEETFSAVEKLGMDPRKVLPPEMSAIMDHTGAELPSFQPGDMQEAAEKMLSYGSIQLDALYAAGDNSNVEVPFGAIALNRRIGGHVVVLGRDPNPQEKEQDYFTVIDSDDNEYYKTHIDNLELLEEYEDPTELEIRLWRLAKKMTSLLPQLVIRPNDGTPTGAFMHTVAAGMVFRFSCNERMKGMARIAQKTMLGSYKDLPKEMRSRAVALLPELVNTHSKQAHQAMGHESTLIGPLQNAIDQYLKAKEQRVVISRTNGDDAITKHSADTTEDNGTNEEVETVAVAHSVIDADKIEEPEQQYTTAPKEVRQSSTAITFKVNAKPLRFKLSHYALLALEWRLPTTESAFQEAITTTLNWLSNRIGMTLPGHWNSGGHEIEHAGVRLEVEAAKALYAIRLEHPDTQHPTRTWRLEASVVAGRGGRGGMVGLRLETIDRVELPAPQTSLPTLIKRWVESPGLLVGDGMAQEYRRIDTEEDMEWLQQAIADPDREAPVWVVSEETSIDSYAQAVGVGRFVLMGIVYRPVYQVRYGALSIDELHHFAPKSQTAENHSLRTAYDRQQWLNKTIASRMQLNTPTFREIRDVIRDTSFIRNKPAIPSELTPENTLPMVVTPMAPEPIASGNSETSIPEPVATQEPQTYAYNDLKELFDLALDEKDVLQNDLEQTKEDLRQARSRIHALQLQLRPANAATSNIATPVFPGTLADLPQWAESLQHRVVFGDKALRLAAKTEHRDVTKIYASIQALHDIYWVMRFGNDETARHRWLEFLKTQRMDFGPVGHALENGRYSPGYQVVYGRRTLEMEYHIQGSSTRDPMRCIRIYLAIDDVEKKLIIGHLPTHLENSHS